MLSGSQELINRLVLYYFGTVIAMALHEWAHAVAAVSLGDQTPREQGRLTLNPVVHMDLLGTVIVPITMIFLGHVPIAWAKPVQITPYRFTRKIWVKTGIMLTAAAGPLMNLLLAAAAVFTIAAFGHYGIAPGGAAAREILQHFVIVNIMLFLFNLLPVPPLDGSRVVRGFLSQRLRDGYAQMDRFAPVFLVILFFVPGTANVVHEATELVYAGLQRAALVFFP